MVVLVHLVLLVAAEVELVLLAPQRAFQQQELVEMVVIFLML